MKNNEWNDLVSVWNAGAADVDPTPLIEDIRRKQRWRWLGLVNELAGTLCVLSLLIFAWSRPSTMSGFMPWLLGAATLVIAWQSGYLLIRHRLRLFGETENGLVGLYDAEINHARYVIAYLWFGLAGGIFVIGWMLVAMPQAAVFKELVIGLMVAVFIFVGYAVARTAWLRTRIGRLRFERDRIGR